MLYARSRGFRATQEPGLPSPPPPFGGSDQTLPSTFCGTLKRHRRRDRATKGRGIDRFIQSPPSRDGSKPVGQPPAGDRLQEGLPGFSLPLPPLRAPSSAAFLAAPEHLLLLGVLLVNANPPLTIRSPHNVLQKGVLGSHQPSPSPSHSHVFRSPARRLGSGLREAQRSHSTLFPL